MTQVKKSQFQRLNNLLMMGRVLPRVYKESGQTQEGKSREMQGKHPQQLLSGLGPEPGDAAHNLVLPGPSTHMADI